MWTSWLSDYGQKAILSLFYMFGVSVFHRPFLYLLCGVVITALCGLGFLNSSYENNGLYLWVPQESEVFKNFETTQKYFGENPHELLMIFESTDGSNLLTPSKMDVMWEIFQVAMNVTLDYEGETYQFRDLCERPYESYPKCDSLEEGFFSMFNFDPTQWQNYSQIVYWINVYSSYLPFYIGGDVTYDESGSEVLGATFVRFNLQLDVNFDEDDTTLIEEYEFNWEDYWIDHENDWKSSDNIEIHFLTSVSFNGEIDRVVSGDVPILAAAFIVMTVYLGLTLGRLNCVECRLLAALSSVLATICALVMGLGLGSAFGFDLNAIVLLIPFILLGVGVDDDIIIVETLQRTPLPEDDPLNQDLQFGYAMKHAGLSITLTSLSSVIAFAIGSAADLPGISSFCFYAALSFFSNYISQFVIFVPLLTLDQRRIVSNRNCVVCCIKHENFSPHKEIEMMHKNTGGEPTEPHETSGLATNNLNVGDDSVDSSKLTPATSADTTIDPSDPSDPSEASAATTTGAADASGASGTSTNSTNTSDTFKTSKNSKINVSQQSWTSKISSEYVLTHTLVPLLSKRWFRIATIFVFAGLLAASAVSLQWLDTETDIATLVPDDSFTLDFIDGIVDGFGETSAFDTCYLVIEDRDFSDAATRAQAQELVVAFDDFDSKWAETAGEVNHWMDEFELWISETYDNMSVIDVSEEGLYYVYLKQFVNSSGRVWQDFIVFDDDDEPSRIRATRFDVLMSLPDPVKDRWYAYPDMEDSFEGAMGSNSGFAFAVLLLYGYLANAIVSLTINNLLFTGIGVFGALVFLMDLRMSIFIVLTIAMIDIDLFGWMNLNGIPLDTLSYGELVMAVGLTVDYVIHIAHAISHANPPNRNDFDARVKIAMMDMGVGVAKGALTTFLGTMTLAFSQSQAFRVFFLMFCGIIVISSLHGFLLIPSLLGEMPFIYWESEEDAQERAMNDPVQRQLSQRLNLETTETVPDSRI